MKRLIVLVIFITALFNLAFSQLSVNQGKPVGEFFTDFHINLDDSTKTSGFGINRAHLGYTYCPAEHFITTVIVSIGSPEDLASGSVPKRYAYFREASIAYVKDNLTVNFGMVSTRIFDFQQRFWGKRYLGPEFQATYGYGSVADLGVVLDYKISDAIKIDFSLLNGEGYTNIQADNNLRSAIGMTLTTQSKFSARLYADITGPNGVLQNTFIAFAGIKRDHLSIGGEASYKTNIDLVSGHDAWGLSATGAYIFDAKSEIFLRYDYMSSVTMPGEFQQWCYKKDGTYMIAGFQRSIGSILKLALNFRHSQPYSSAYKSTNAIYLNALVKF